MDLADQLTAVWARRFLVLGAALAAAAVVFAWRSSIPPRYEAAATVQVRLTATSSGDPATEVDYFARTVVGMATSRQVVSTALGLAGRPDDLDEVAGQVTAETSEEPGFITILGVGSSGVDAARLANALATAVAKQAAENQDQDLATDRASISAAIAVVDASLASTPAEDTESRAALSGEREALVAALRTAAGRSPWQVRTVEPAQIPDGPAAPRPAREGGLAFLVVGVLTAEAVVLRRRWRGQLPLRDPAGSVAAEFGTPAVALTPDSGPGALAALLPAIGPARVVTVVRRALVPGARTGSLLATLLSRRQDVLLVDGCAVRPAVHLEMHLPLSPGLAELPRQEHALREALAELPAVHRLRVLTAGDPRREKRTVGALARLVKTDTADCVVVTGAWDRWEELAAVFGDLDGPVLLEVDLRSTTRRGLRAELDSLRGLGAEVAGVALVAGGQRPRWRRSERRSQRHHWAASNGQGRSEV